jgi:hypothetical protein
MLFKDAQIDGIRAGSTTRTYRRWRSPRVRVDGVYRLRPDVSVRVTDVREWTQPLTSRDARAAGFDDPAALESALAAYANGTRLYRVDFERCATAPDPRRVLANAQLADEDVEGICVKLAAMDRRTKDGPWTSRVLHAIERQPATRARDLADAMGLATAEFKTRVRRLKALGLTESLQVGYRLSPRGRSYLDRDR